MSQFYSNDGIDTESIDEKIDPELLRIFKKDVKKALSQLHSISQNPNNRTLTIATHNMKSALKNVKLRNASLLAADLESAARKADEEFISQNLPRFIQRLEKLR